MEGRILVEKMTKKIKQWSSKQLSYAGRLILINSVLMAIHAYWAQIMPLPRKMLKEIANVCRSFLWKGKGDMESPGLVAWENLCQAKSKGGLGCRDILAWNKAALFKHIWAIAEKKDCLWVRWVHHIYLKGDSIWEHQAPQDASFYWKKLI